ncbi:DUF2591 domain-containing protein [Hafnia alvei]|uniref:phage protein NinX family protein n=1 Tax=Hafnia alvei TaxID=569 RepID=UPI0010338C78|nr:phage protein NinX family protein [Hafnia alvei]TBM10138.1 DUF2591 domain-containing protein [Hafnia alvei]
MTDYSKMSDFDVTCMVAKFIHPDAELLDVNRGKTESSITLKFGPHGYMGFDPCNNPSDAWPIIVEEKISIMFDSTLPEYEGEYHEWCSAISSCQKYGIQYQSNPLRAAMIVYLMMKESENGI